MAQKATEFVGRVGKLPKGAGPGIGLLAAAGGLAYAAYHSVYTGMLHSYFIFLFC